MNRKKDSAFLVLVCLAVGLRAEPRRKRWRIFRMRLESIYQAVDELVEGQEVRDLSVAS